MPLVELWMKKKYGERRRRRILNVRFHDYINETAEVCTKMMYFEYYVEFTRAQLLIEKKKFR